MPARKRSPPVDRKRQPEAGRDARPTEGKAARFLTEGQASVPAGIGPRASFSMQRSVSPIEGIGTGGDRSPGAAVQSLGQAGRGREMAGQARLARPSDRRVRPAMSPSVGPAGHDLGSSGTGLTGSVALDANLPVRETRPQFDPAEYVLVLRRRLISVIRVIRGQY
jgi:hypothetical protein